jgi:hypothetical protein
METVCLHSPCKCPPARNSDYCCDACSSADMSGGVEGGVCGCGHVDCRPERRAVPPAPEL